MSEKDIITTFYNLYGSIFRQIEKGLCIENLDKLSDQTWEKYEQAICGRHLFIFGIGNGFEFYIRRCSGNKIQGVIDNNVKLQGIKLSRILPKELTNIYGHLCVSDISILNEFDPDEIVVLVTSLKYYEQIFEQLDSNGIKWKFSLLCMEANRRNNTVTQAKEKIELQKQEEYDWEINSKKIVFLNQGSYCGHGKYITEQLLKLRVDLDIVWVVNDLTEEVPDGIRLISERNRRAYYYEMETAKIWVSDYTLPDILTKRQGQIFVMVKHWSSITLKSFGLDIIKFKNITSPKLVRNESGDDMDYIIVGSKFDEESCRRGFAFKGEVYYAGSPRSDILFHSRGIREKICEQYHIDKDCQILTYAPTFRYGPEFTSKWEVRSIGLDYEWVKQTLEKNFGGKWCILLRLHPAVMEKSYGVKKPEYVINVSKHPDSQELIAASDILITDYSSIMFEPAFVKKPVFLFATDKKEYINGERELLIDYDTLPFPIAESNEELVQNIQNFNRQEYEENVTKFLDKYDVHEDGHASERAAAFISTLIDNNK